MHIFNKILNILGINLAMLTVPTVLASGVINFTGEITEQACTVDSKSRNLNVDLGRVSTRSLSSQGEVAGVTNFIIKLVDCPDDTKVTVNFAGTRDSVDHHILALHQVNVLEQQHKISSGIVATDGEVYLSGVPENSVVQVKWGANQSQQCQLPLHIDLSNSNIQFIEGTCQ